MRTQDQDHWAPVSGRVAPKHLSRVPLPTLPVSAQRPLPLHRHPPPPAYFDMDIWRQAVGEARSAEAGAEVETTAAHYIRLESANLPANAEEESQGAQG